MISKVEPHRLSTVGPPPGIQRIVPGLLNSSFYRPLPPDCRHNTWPGMGARRAVPSGPPLWPQQVSDHCPVSISATESDPFEEASPHRFSMQQEARNTEFHSRIWSNSSLRHKAVQFVSAGEFQRSEFEDADQPHRDEDTHNQTGTAPEKSGPVTESSQQPTDDARESLFYIDPIGQYIPDTGFPDPPLQPESIDTDITSEDEVVFTGRNATTKATIIETPSDELQEMLRNCTDRPPSVPIAPDWEQSTVQTHPQDISHSHVTSSTKRKKIPPEVHDTLADYIANIDRDYYEEEEEENITIVKQNQSHGGVDVDKASATGADIAEELEVQSSIDGKCSFGSPRLEANAEAPVLSRMNLDSESHVAAVLDDGPEESDESDGFGAVSVSEDGDIDTELLEDLALEYAKKGKTAGSRGNLPILSASAFADALEDDPYYGFDIMDFDRPSLQKKGKGKMPPALDLMPSDSDMEFRLQEVWQSDRKKKKAKKKEREELRSQGLLGREPRDPDLKVKYSKGMNVEEVMTEIRAFLLSPRTRYVCAFFLCLESSLTSI